jgi:hypothetical protein
MMRFHQAAVASEWLELKTILAMDSRSNILNYVCMVICRGLRGLVLSARPVESMAMF